VWIGDLSGPNISALVLTSDLLERPLTEVDVAHDRYDVETRRALREEWGLASREAGYYVYRRR